MLKQVTPDNEEALQLAGSLKALVTLRQAQGDKRQEELSIADNIDVQERLSFGKLRVNWLSLTEDKEVLW